MAAAGEGQTVGGVGESLPFAAETFDVIVSNQVLEHVQSPKKVIQEAYRVLKPGGYFFLTYENYLSFYEPHYRVRWFPILPKPIGSMYLKAIGRDPTFLREAITYTTYPVVRRIFRSTGFECIRIEGFRNALRSPEKDSLKWRAVKGLSAFGEGLPLSLMASVDYARHVFRTSISECMRKPVL